MYWDSVDLKKFKHLKGKWTIINGTTTKFLVKVTGLRSSGPRMILDCKDGFTGEKREINIDTRYSIDIKFYDDRTLALLEF